MFTVKTNPRYRWCSFLFEKHSVLASTESKHARACARRSLLRVKNSGGGRKSNSGAVLAQRGKQIYKRLSWLRAVLRFDNCARTRALVSASASEAAAAAAVMWASVKADADEVKRSN